MKKWLKISLIVLGVIILLSILGILISNFSLSEGGRYNSIPVSPDEEISEIINELFGSDEKVVIYPTSEKIEIRQGDQGYFVLGIKNVLNNFEQLNFSYKITPTSKVQEDCGTSDSDVLSLFIAGTGYNSDITIATGDYYLAKILLENPKDGLECIVRFRIDVKNGQDIYSSKAVYVEFTKPSLLQRFLSFFKF
jgi:hypothetical protein